MFKVGDKVIVKSGYDEDNLPALWTRKMLCFQGKKAKILRILKNSYYGIICVLDFDGELFNWNMCSTELLLLNNEELE